jgi:hypothetical protein
MTSQRNIKRLQNWVWILIYGGLLTFILGLAVWRVEADLAPWFIVPGAVAAITGFVLIVVRSKLTVDDA